MVLVVSGNLALGTSADLLPLTHPRIGYQNLLRNSNCVITASTEQTDYEGDSVINGLTWDYWKPTTTPATLTFVFDEAVDVDYCGIAAHTLSETGCAIELEYYDGADWVSLGNVQPQSTNKVIMFLFDSVTSNQWRLSITGGSSVPSIGVVNLGTALALQRRIYGGHTPITLSKKTTIKPQKSEGGQWLGRSIVREGAATNIEIKNVTAPWVREYLEPFIESCRTYPFFWAWRPGDYPNEVAYCWTGGDIAVTNSGQANLMNTSFSVDAIIV